MANLHRLAVKTVKGKRKRGMYSDGGGLYLRVTATRSKSWMFRWRDGGKLRDMGLGSVDLASDRTIGASLRAARETAAKAREHVHAGRDPLAERDRERAERRAEAANTATFAECARRYIGIHAPGWKNAKHSAQWSSTLATYAFPIIGDMPVRDVETPHILRVLEPVWATKTETATRVRQRIESVLDWSKVQGYRQGENPARWRGHLDKSLPKPGKVKRVRHHAAMPYAEMASFLQELGERRGTVARALEFTIYTAARTTESRAARWSEFDLAAGVWIVPAERVKSDREHRVPLSPAALAVVKRQEGLDREYVFPGEKPGKPISNMAMLSLLQDQMGKSCTVHGFRSTFRDWAADCTNYPREIAEAALAHTLKDKTEAAYRRSDLFEKRRRLMLAWAKHCKTKPAANVVPIGKRSKRVG